MKHLLTLIIVCLAFVLQAQPDNELLIFSTEGNICIDRGAVEMKNIYGEKILNGDVLKITDGSITIINNDNKRVVVNTPGTYKHSDIAKLMHKAEASLTNRYFVYVWKKMNKEEKSVNRPGGIIRGDADMLAPADSVTVLSDYINFYYQNPSGQEFKLIIKDKDFKVLNTFSISDSLFNVSLSEINNRQPGRYVWEIELPFVGAPEARCFFIPDADTRNLLLKGLNEALSAFSEYSYSFQTALINEYLEKNRLYMSN